MESVQKKLQKYVKKFEKEDLDYYDAVQQTFRHYPRNIDEVAVAIKFSVLNQLYSTVILDKDSMINHIHKLATQEGLDDMLQKGDLEAVEKIRKGHKILTKSKKERDNYSFATKYCHFSNPKCYPLYDQYVERAIMELRKTRDIKFETQEELYDPKTFKGIINQIIGKFGLIDYQNVDRALWKYGKALAEQKKRG